MQEPPPLQSVERDILVFPGDDRKFAEDRVSVVPLGINRVFTVSEMGPHPVGQVLKLRGSRPILELGAMDLMVAQDFLKQHEVRLDFLDGGLDLLQHEFGAAGAEAFMDVVGDDPKLHDFLD